MMTLAMVYFSYCVSVHMQICILLDLSALQDFRFQFIEPSYPPSQLIQEPPRQSPRFQFQILRLIALLADEIPNPDLDIRSPRVEAEVVDLMSGGILQY